MRWFKQSPFKLLAPLLCLLLVLLFLVSYPRKKENYGVFLGLSMTPDGAEEGLHSDDKETDQLVFLSQYKTVVLSPGSFTKENLLYLHRAGTKAYAYINVGALENYAPEYSRFKALSLPTKIGRTRHGSMYRIKNGRIILRKMSPKKSPSSALTASSSIISTSTINFRKMKSIRAYILY